MEDLSGLDLFKMTPNYTILNVYSNWFSLFMFKILTVIGLSFYDCQLGVKLSCLTVFFSLLFFW